ncbi:MAG: homoserine dehydrogenase [Candidatus Bathyarchaeota archaeon B63]|nr:MAG: homoserine dehydrogenase [Candidatus Bathyarchaeota archaeon B63]
MNIIVIGFGFIGRGVIEAFLRKAERIRRLDEDFRVVGVSDSRGYVYDSEGLDLKRLIGVDELSQYPSGYCRGGSAEDLIEMEGVDLMVEATPTNVVDGEPGLTFMRRALRRGIHVVTSNKGPLVVAFHELKSLAEEGGCQLLFEGTVAGAIPIFSLVRESLQGDEILRISGILNGTTNYILSRMHFEGTSFEIALKEAQERGITERDPSYDVDGIDAACKVVILANALMNRDVRFEDVERTGIRRVTQEAVSLAKRSNFAIKLVGTIDRRIEVAPKLVPINHPLCVHGTLNAVHIEADLAGEITLVGYGAGRETVSAVLNDVLTVLKSEAKKKG